MEPRTETGNCWGTFFHSTQPAYLLKRGGAVSPSPEDSRCQKLTTEIGHFQGPRMKLFMSENPWIQFNRWCWCVKCNKTLKRILNQWREHFWATFTRLHTPELRIFFTRFSRKLPSFGVFIHASLAPFSWLRWMVSKRSIPTSPRKSIFPKADGMIGWCLVDLVVCF